MHVAGGHIVGLGDGFGPQLRVVQILHHVSLHLPKQAFGAGSRRGDLPGAVHARKQGKEYILAAASPSASPSPLPLVVVVRASWARKGIACPASRPGPESMGDAERRDISSARGPNEPFGNAEDEHLERFRALEDGRPRRVLEAMSRLVEACTSDRPARSLIIPLDIRYSRMHSGSKAETSRWARATRWARPWMDLHADGSHLATGQAGLEGWGGDRLDMHRKEPFGDSRRPIFPSFGGRNRSGVEDGAHGRSPVGAR